MQIKCLIFYRILLILFHKILYTCYTTVPKYLFNLTLPFRVWTDFRFCAVSHSPYNLRLVSVQQSVKYGNIKITKLETKILVSYFLVFSFNRFKPIRSFTCLSDFDFERYLRMLQWGARKVSWEIFYHVRTYVRKDDSEEAQVDKRMDQIRTRNKWWRVE